jgi:hypothetical protein
MHDAVAMEAVAAGIGHKPSTAWGLDGVQEGDALVARDLPVGRAVQP